MDGTNLMSEDHSKALRFYLDKILKWNYRVTQFVSDLKHGIMTLTSIRKVVTDKKLNQIICAQLLSSPRHSTIPTTQVLLSNKIINYIFLHASIFHKLKLNL